MSEDILQALSLLNQRLRILECDVQPMAMDSCTQHEVPASCLAAHDEWEGIKRELSGVYLGVLPQQSGSYLKKAIWMFNKYIFEIYHVDIHFTFLWENMKYMTVTALALFRNTLLIRHCSSYRPTIVEPFAGCGADTISFMLNMNPSVIYCSDPNETNKLLFKKNIENIKHASGQTLDTHIQWFSTTANDFFHKVSEPDTDGEGGQKILHIDLLYLDPPWKIQGAKENMTADQMVDYLNKEVFDSMFKRGFQPRVIVLKMAFDYNQMKTVMSRFPTAKDSSTGLVSPVYSHTESIKARPINGEYSFHILVNNTIYASTEWDPDDLFNNIYNGIASHGKPHDGRTKLINYSRN
jgi:16S rRNA G966 N2-methylase RsmD